MALNARQQFKVELLEKFADAGLTPAESLEAVREYKQLVKQSQEGAGLSIPFLGTAQAMANKTVDVGAHGAKGLIDKALQVGTPMLLGGPFIAGGGLGYLASKLGDIDDDDVDAAKKRELVALYKQYSDQVRQRDKLHQMMANK